MVWSQEPARTQAWPSGCFACGRQDLASVVVAYRDAVAVAWLCEQCAGSAGQVQQFQAGLARAAAGAPVVVRTFPGVRSGRSLPDHVARCGSAAIEEGPVPAYRGRGARGRKQARG